MENKAPDGSKSACGLIEKELNLDWFQVPKELLTSMPLIWQMKFMDLMEQLNAKLEEKNGSKRNTL